MENTDPTPGVAADDVESQPMPQVRIAAPPFDRSGADVVLQSSDKVNFYVYKTVLFLASSFFETMFSLAQPSCEIADAPRRPLERPLIEVSEDSETLDALLRFCYPVHDPRIQTIEQLDKVLEAALKYDIPVAVQLLRGTLQNFIPYHPREVFAIACRHTLEEEARKAAQTWKSVVKAEIIAQDFKKSFPYVTFIPQMRSITAGAYHRLLSYLRTGHLPTQLCSPPALLATEPSARDQETKPSFNTRDGDVILRLSNSSRYFRVHRLVLTIHDFNDFLAATSSSDPIDGIPAYQVAPDITSDVLEKLLLLCYPDGFDQDCRHGPIHWSLYSRLVEIATRYRIHAIIRVLRRSWTRDAAHDSLAFYIIAVRYGWLQEAQEGANFLLLAPLDELYHPELEKASAASYQSLLKFHHLYRTTVAQEIAKHGISHHRYSFGLETINISSLRDTWSQSWLGGPNTSGKYLRDVPFIIAQLHAQVYKQMGLPFDFEKMVADTQAVENTIKQVAHTVRIEFA